MDLAAALTRGVYEQGAEYFKLMIVATGERSVFPNVGPTDRILKRGDVCRVEIFPMIDGYHAGVCRTAAVGAPPPRGRAHLGQPDGLQVSPARCHQARRLEPRDLRTLSRASSASLHLPPISFIGHGIGLHLHEDPYLGPTDDQPLEAGMVLGIEPLVYETGFGFGMQNKDMVLVTDTRLRAAVGLRQHRQAHHCRLAGACMVMVCLHEWTRAGMSRSLSSTKPVTFRKRDCTMRRRDVLALGLSSLSVAALRSLPASAQGKYPDQPIRLIVPRSAGGVVDVVAPPVGRAGQAAARQHRDREPGRRRRHHRARKRSRAPSRTATRSSPAPPASSSSAR